MMEDYITHWEFIGESAILVVRENITSSLPTYKRLWFTMEQYHKLQLN